MRRVLTVMLASAVCLFGAAGCGDDHDHEDGGHGHDPEGHAHEPVGPDSGATCPTGGSTLTYENFAEPFFEKYCLRCHSIDVKGAARNDAPDDHNFDELAQIELVGHHIDQLAAFGPEAENVAMPPGDPKPTDDDRKKLGQWIACGFKE